MGKAWPWERGGEEYSMGGGGGTLEREKPKVLEGRGWGAKIRKLGG